MSEINKHIFGLDISDRALRLIKFKKNGKKIILSSYNDLAIAPGIIENGEIKNGDKLAKLLNQLVKQVKGKKISGGKYKKARKKKQSRILPVLR